MTDLDIIKQIEKELNEKLLNLKNIVQNIKCYTLNQIGQVTGLGLYNCKIENLNRIISPLKALTNLTKLTTGYQAPAWQPQIRKALAFRSNKN